MRERAFWRFLLFIGLLVMVKPIYQHYHATWPKYVLREMGESFPLGKIIAINPILIIFLVPLATAVTRHYDVFKTILVGSIVSSLSVFICVLARRTRPSSGWCSCFRSAKRCGSRASTSTRR